jgi:hypothetical protein
MAGGRIYFRLYHDDQRFGDQWFLRGPRAADGVEIEPWSFTEGLPYLGPRPVTLEVRQPGKSVGFSLGAFNMPIVSKTVGETVRRVAPNAAEYFSVVIDGASSEFEILNAVCLVDCLDESRSEFTRWEQSDNRPEKLGQYRMISTMRIDPERVSGHRLFRIAGWPLALVVSDSLKAALEDIPSLGVVFESVV